MENLPPSNARKPPILEPKKPKNEALLVRLRREWKETAFFGKGCLYCIITICTFPCIALIVPKKWGEEMAALPSLLILVAIIVKMIWESFKGFKIERSKTSPTVTLTGCFGAAIVWIIYLFVLVTIGLLLWKVIRFAWS